MKKNYKHFKFSAHFFQCCRAGPGGAEMIFLINIYCRQFGGCKDEEKPALRHISYGTTGTVIDYNSTGSTVP